MPVIKTLARFTESFVFYSIDFSGFKNMPDIRTNNGRRLPDIGVATVLLGVTGNPSTLASNPSQYIGDASNP